MNIRIISNMLVLTSDIKAQELELLEKAKPSALTIKDEDGQPVFSFKYAFGSEGALTKHGIKFNDRDQEGNARLSVALPSAVEPEQRVQLVKDNYAGPISSAKTYQSLVIDAATELKSVLDSVMNTITVE